MNTEPTNINLENINLEGDIDTKKSNSIEPTKATQQTKTAFGMFSSVPQIDLNALKPQEWISKRRETLKPWTEFASFSKFKKPTGVGQGVSRLVKNVDHFQSNYLFVFIFLAIYCVVTSPLLLFAFMGFMGGLYIIHLKNKDGQLKLLGKEIGIAQLYTAAGVCSIPLFLLAGGGSAVFWIIGASIFVIVLHAVFYSRDEEDPFVLQMNVV